MNLARLFQSRPPTAANFWPKRVGYAVGDIHGRADLLSEMIALLERRADQERREAGDPIVIFLGDYVDRGPHAAGVLDLLIAGRPEGYERRFLKGNHEEMMLAFMDAPLQNRSWITQGGAETLLAYGVTPPSPLDLAHDVWFKAAEDLKAAVPAPHMAFLGGLERYVVAEDYVFVHAGVNLARSIEQQTDEDLYWSREKFLNSRKRFPLRVVHGHTPADLPFADERRIGLDTGAYATGVLTAARFEGDGVRFLSVTASGAKWS